MARNCHHGLQNLLVANPSGFDLSFHHSMAQSGIFILAEDEQTTATQDEKGLHSWILCLFEFSETPGHIPEKRHRLSGGYWFSYAWNICRLNAWCIASIHVAITQLLQIKNKRRPLRSCITNVQNRSHRNIWVWFIKSIACCRWVRTSGTTTSKGISSLSRERIMLFIKN